MDIPTIFQERIDKTLQFKHPDWLDDIFVTKGTIEKHETEIKETMKKLEDGGYRLHREKPFFNTEAKRCFATHDEDNDYFNMRIYIILIACVYIQQFNFIQ